MLGRLQTTKHRPELAPSLTIISKYESGYNVFQVIKYEGHVLDFFDFYPVCYVGEKVNYLPRKKHINANNRCEWLMNMSLIVTLK